MNWLVWKQHRKMFIILAVILALYAALVIPAGLHFWHAYHRALATCSQTNTCDQLSNDLFQTNWDNNINPSLPGGSVNLVVLLLLALPFALGMFIGVPLIAKEYNEGTNLLVWTRSTPRHKWLTLKLVWILVASAVFAGVFAALTTWWSKTGNIVYDDRFNAVKFDIQGMAPVAYAVFAVSLGIALGAWLKRIMLAIGLTLIILMTTQIVVGSFVRKHYLRPVSYSGPVVPADGIGYGGLLSPYAPPKSGAAWVVGGRIVGKGGQLLSWSNPPNSCVVSPPTSAMDSGGVHVKAVSARDPIVSRDGGPTVNLACLDRIGYHWDTKYQPAYRYWDFQRIEMGLYLALSIIAIGATYWLVLKRDA